MAQPVIGRCDVLNEAYFVWLPPATTAEYDAACGDSSFRSSFVMGPNGQEIVQVTIKRGARRGTSGLVDLCCDYPDVSVRIHPISPSTHSKLPTELLCLIFSRVCRRDLALLTQASNTFYNIAIRLLYQDLTLRSLPTRQWIRCLRTLTRNPSLPPLVRSLDVEWQPFQPTYNLYHLLHIVLRSLTSLKFLNLDFPTHQSPTWILDGCTFSLRHFTTSLHCKAPLARFLESQPGIVELTLRGFQNAKSSLNPFNILNPELDIEPLSTDFELKQDSLPSLTLFNAVHAGPPIIRTVAHGRGVRTASVPLFPRCATGTLDALTLTSGSIRRLSLISFDPAAPSFLFGQLADRFPRLEALHVVLLLTQCNSELLNSTTAHLEKFRSLQYITFMATMNTEEDIDERDIAKRWHEACPTLRTIILPKGKVWFDAGAQSGWSCLDHDE